MSRITTLVRNPLHVMMPVTIFSSNFFIIFFRIFCGKSTRRA